MRATTRLGTWLLTLTLALAACGGSGEDANEAGSSALETGSEPSAIDASNAGSPAEADPTTGTPETDPSSATEAAATVPQAALVSSLPAGYVRCAGEWQAPTCNFSGRTVLAFGAPGGYVTGEVAGPFNCNTGNAVFGDPLRGAIKSCYVPATVLAPPTKTTVTALPSGYVKCTDERSAAACKFSGRVLMAYGATGRYVTGEVPGPFACSTGNVVFGDPLPGVLKSCYVPSSVLTPGTGPSTARIASVELAQSLLFPSGDSALVLVAGKDVLVKVNVTASSASEAKPAGSLRIETTSGQLVQTLALTPPTGNLPTAVPLVPSFATAYTAIVPASRVQAGLRLTATLANGQRAAPVDPRVGGGIAMRFVAVPVQLGASVGQVVANPHTYLQARLPVASVTLQTRAPYVSRSVTSLPTTEQAWSNAFSRVLGELDDLHTLEQASAQTYYYGFMPKRSYGLAGLGFMPGRAALGFDIPNSPTAVLEVMTHELGHNLSLPHAPCGGPADADPQYPYANAKLGAAGRYIWGYNAVTRTFTDPRRTDLHDIMSYCNGDTFSDYNYRRIQGYLTPADRAVRAASAEAGASQEAPQELLLVSGQIEAGATVELSPLKSLFGQARPPQAGPYTLRVTTAKGPIDHRFALKPLDHASSVQRFGFTIPHPGTIVSLAVLKDGVMLWQSVARNAAATSSGTAQIQSAPASASRVQASEQDGVLRLAWDPAAYPYLTVTHVGAQRTTLAQDLQGGKAALPIGTLPAGGSFEFSLSDGLNTVRVPQAR